MARTPEEEQKAEQRRRAAAMAAGGALAIGAGPDAPVAEIPDAAARVAVGSTIIAGLVAFMVDQRQRMHAWLSDKLRTRGPVSLDDVSKVLADEERREDAFAQKQVARLNRDLATVLAIPDQTAREGALRGLMSREERYARQRAEAMAARSFAAVDRVVLRQQSPNGAFWELDPNVQEHTAGCLLMGGKFWPWAVLNRVYPPRHHGCPCRLRGYGEAVARGLMGPGDVPDVKDAIRRAAAVVMEGALRIEPEDAAALIAAGGLLEEEGLREALMAAGMLNADVLAALDQ